MLLLTKVHKDKIGYNFLIKYMPLLRAMFVFFSRTYLNYQLLRYVAEKVKPSYTT